jgi:hypothetical protein
MKIPTILTIALIAATTLLRAEPPTPPSLPLAKAVAIAQTTLDSLKLPPEYFLRSISYRPLTDKEPTAFYRASFEPTKTRRVMVGSTPEPVKIKYIKVLMNGTASVIEEEISSDRRTIKSRPVQD